MSHAVCQGPRIATRATIMNCKRRPSLTSCHAVVALAATLAGCSVTQPVNSTRGSNQLVAPHHAASSDMDGYYLSRCAACPSLLGAKGEAIDVIYDGRPLRFCCEACRVRLDTEPHAVLSGIDDAMIEDQLPHYPIDTSLIDGKPLGNRPVNFIWGNRLFRARNEADRTRILANPAAVLRTLDKAVLAAQTPTYALPEKCPVQGDILPKDPVIDVVVANRMIRVCCGRCVRVVKARPYQYIGMVDFANAEHRQRHDESGEANQH